MAAPSAEEIAFAEALPRELRNGLDFVSSLLVVLLGFTLRKLGLIRDEHIPGMQALTFTFCMPMLVLLVLWSCELKMELLKVFGFSSLIHSVWVLCAWLLVQTRVARPSERGFLAMACTGSGLGYVYPVLLGSERFGMDSLGIVAMYDMGGSMPVAVIIYAFMASWYAPANFVDSQDNDMGQAKTEAVRLQTASSALRPRPRAAIAETPTGAEAHGSAPCVIGITSDDISVQDASNADENIPGTDEQQVSDPPGVVSPSKSTARRAFELARPVARNPVIYGVFLGLLLNLLQVPLYPLPVRAVRGLMACYPPLLYALLGVTLRFDLGRKSYGLVARALFFRLLFCTAVVLFVRYALPLNKQARGVLTICVSSPIAASFIMYSAQFGYRMDHSAMTYNVAAIISMPIMSFLVHVA